MERGDTGLGRDAFGLPRRRRLADRRAFRADDGASPNGPDGTADDEFGHLLRRPGDMPPQPGVHQPGRGPMRPPPGRFTAPPPNPANGYPPNGAPGTGGPMTAGPANGGSMNGGSANGGPMPGRQYRLPNGRRVPPRADRPNRPYRSSAPGSTGGSSGPWDQPGPGWRPGQDPLGANWRRPLRQQAPAGPPPSADPGPQPYGAGANGFTGASGHGGAAGHPGDARFPGGSAFAAGGAGSGPASSGSGSAGSGYPGSGYGGSGQAGYGGSGQAGYGGSGFAGTGYADQRHASTGYGDQGHGGSGAGHADPGRAGTGFAGTGYGDQGRAGTGFAGNGYADPGHAGTGFTGTGYGNSGHASTGYAGPGAGPDGAGAAGAGTAGARSEKRPGWGRLGDRTARGGRGADGEAAEVAGQVIRQRETAIPEDRPTTATQSAVVSIAPDGLDSFARDLRALRAKAELDYPEMAETSHYTMKTLVSAAGGLRLPTLPVAVAYVRACGGDAVEWEERWQKLAAKITSDAARKRRIEGKELLALPEPSDQPAAALPEPPVTPAAQEPPAEAGEVYVITSAKPRQPGW